MLDAPIELEIVFRLCSKPNLVGAARYVVVVMSLVEKRRNPRGIDDWKFLQPRGFNQPVVKPRATNGEIGNSRVHVLWKEENVDARVVFRHTSGSGPKLERLLPARLKLQGFGNVQVDAAGNHQGIRRAPLDDVSSPNEFA